MKQDDPQFKLRLKPELKEQLEGSAKENTRTLGAEIVARLEASYRSTQELAKEAESDVLDVRNRYDAIISRSEVTAARIESLLNLSELLEEVGTRLANTGDANENELLVAKIKRRMTHALEEMKSLYAESKRLTAERDALDKIAEASLAKLAQVAKAMEAEIAQVRQQPVAG